VNRYFNAYTIFVLVFLFNIVWIFQGLDVTDHGFHLTNQVRAFDSHSAGEFSAMWFLTDFVAGMWLRIINRPSVLWARLGGVLLVSLNASLSYSILSVHFDRRKVFPIVFVSTLFIAMTGTSLIHYYTFPSLLVLLGLLFFNQMLNKPIESISFRLHSFLVGFIAIPIILARFPLILIIFIPVLLILDYLITKEDTAKLRKSVPYVIPGIISSLILFALIYGLLGVLSVYLAAIKSQIFASATGNQIVARHGISGMAIKYMKEYRYLTRLTFIVSMGLFLVSMLKDRIGGRIGTLVSAVFIAFGSLVALDPEVYKRELIMLMIGLILVVSYIFFTQYKERNRNLELLLLVSVFMMVINPLGSYVGIRKSIQGMWVALPLMLLVTYEFRDGIENKRLKSIFSLNTVVIFLLIPVILYAHFTGIYRDNQNRFKLNTEFKYKYLHHVYSHKERVEVVDGVLEQLDRLTDKNDQVLMINEIPLFYYLTQTRPFFSSSWLFLRPFSKIRTMYEEAIKDKRYPKLFVYSKVDTSSCDWPTTEEIADKNELPILEYLVDKYVNDLSYNLAWENSAFAIYSRPQHYEN